MLRFVGLLLTSLLPWLSHASFIFSFLVPGCIHGSAFPLQRGILSIFEHELAYRTLVTKSYQSQHFSKDACLSRPLTIPISNLYINAWSVAKVDSDLR